MFQGGRNSDPEQSDIDPITAHKRRSPQTLVVGPGMSSVRMTELFVEGLLVTSYSRALANRAPTAERPPAARCLRRKKKPAQTRTHKAQAQNATGQDGMGRNTTRRDGTEQYETMRDGTGNGTGQEGTGRDETETERDGIRRRRNGEGIRRVKPRSAHRDNGSSSNRQTSHSGQPQPQPEN